jgi:hypothetical protein
LPRSEYTVYTQTYTVYTREAKMLGQLADERYISLTTFRRDGSTASTPVWVVSDDGERLLVWTGANTWKVKRTSAAAPPRAGGRLRLSGAQVTSSSRAFSR